jgi:hypothetical protein
MAKSTSTTGYYGNQRQLEYDFIISPEVDDQGDLVLHTAGGQIRQHKPHIYQEIDGKRHEISGGYVLSPKSEIKRSGEIRNPKSQLVAFPISDYDKSKPLIIDPVLSYSTYLGAVTMTSSAASRWTARATLT